MQPIRWFALICFALALIMPVAAQDSPLTVITTTTIIADIARNVGGDLVEVISLVPPEADTHAFQPRPSDLVLLAEADIVLANGLGLEGFLNDLIASADVIPMFVTEGIVPLVYGEDEEYEDHNTDEMPVCEDEAHEEETPETDEHAHGECDPHVWGNPQNVMVMAQNIATTFAELDPAHADVYQANTEAYITELETLDTEIEALFRDIPAEKRLLVTNHEFLGYFADHYSLTIIGTVIPGISTLAEPNPRELAALTQQIRDLGIRAIFVEYGAGAGLSNTLVSEIGDDVQIIELFSESLTAADGLAPTYLDYMRFNAQAIAAAFNL
jgi:zinc/manganese transport system substrate-binding protein